MPKTFPADIYEYPTTQPSLARMIDNLGLTEAACKFLYAKYYEAHRFYHGWNHINAISIYYEKHLENIKRVLDREELRALWLAILFHDVVYEVGSKTNEEDSRNRMVHFFQANLLGPYVNANTISMAAAAIMKTSAHFDKKYKWSAKEHGFTFEDYDGPVVDMMRDLDLAQMADPWWLFERNNKDIDAEFGGLENPDVLRGRIAFLSMVKDVREIYNTWVFAGYNNTAHSNIDIYLTKLLNMQQSGN